MIRGRMLGFLVVRSNNGTLSIPVVAMGTGTICWVIGWWLEILTILVEQLSSVLLMGPSGPFSCWMGNTYTH